ncbi:MAG: hypothetical protein WBD31_16490 [Rubripirellula sp.]
MNLNIDKKTERRIRSLVEAGEFQTVEEAVAYIVYLYKPKRRKAQSQEAGTAFDALHKLGVIGSAGGGPSDLATNPVHMEGFGR